jgi:hypothetical protein
MSRFVVALRSGKAQYGRWLRDRGIVIGLYSLLDGAGETVMSNLDTVLMRVRNLEA